MKENPNPKVEIFAIVVFFIVLFSLATVYINGFSDDYYESSPTVGENRRLIAMVKGSIYESGEWMSVFGTCVDSYDVPIINSTATFSAWYPNGTQYISGVPMSKIAEGYFLYEGAMQVVQGTYLTELICAAEMNGINQTAKAWGEWQNPFWVARLANISGELGNLSVDLSNLSQQIGEGFNNTVANITFLRENMTNNFNYTNTLILETQVIANTSVDRNNSLLASLLYFLVNRSNDCCPVCGNLTWIEYGQGGYGNANDCTGDNDDNDADCNTEEIARYWKNWFIKVKVYDANSDLISSPDVACTINTTQTPVTYMDVEGNHFSFNEFITTPPHADYNWTVNCFCT